MVPLPSGVFTLLTDCYSPTCSRDHLCYSIACPRRLEQQSRQQPGLVKQASRESLGDVAVSFLLEFYLLENPFSICIAWDIVDTFSSAGDRQQCLRRREETPGSDQRSYIY